MNDFFSFIVYHNEQYHSVTYLFPQHNLSGHVAVSQVGRRRLLFAYMLWNTGIRARSNVLLKTRLRYKYALILCSGWCAMHGTRTMTDQPPRDNSLRTQSREFRYNTVWHAQIILIDIHLWIHNFRHSIRGLTVNSAMEFSYCENIVLYKLQRFDCILPDYEIRWPGPPFTNMV